MEDLDKLVQIVRERKKKENEELELKYSMWNIARAKTNEWKLSPRQKDLWLINYHKAKKEGWLEHWSHMFPKWDRE